MNCTGSFTFIVFKTAFKYDCVILKVSDWSITVMGEFSWGTVHVVAKNIYILEAGFVSVI